MRIRTAIILAAPLALALAGCGRSDNASAEAEADTVEIPANEALNGVNDLPVADPNANATLPAEETTTEEERIQAAGDSAADTAAAAADATTRTSAGSVRLTLPPAANAPMEAAATSPVSSAGVIPRRRVTPCRISTAPRGS